MLCATVNAVFSAVCIAILCATVCAVFSAVCVAIFCATVNAVSSAVLYAVFCAIVTISCFSSSVNVVGAWAIIASCCASVNSADFLASAFIFSFCSSVIVAPSFACADIASFCSVVNVAPSFACADIAVFCSVVSVAPAFACSDIAAFCSSVSIALCIACAFIASKVLLSIAGVLSFFNFLVLSSTSFFICLDPLYAVSVPDFNLFAPTANSLVPSFIWFAPSNNLLLAFTNSFTWLYILFKSLVKSSSIPFTATTAIIFSISKFSVSIEISISSGISILFLEIPIFSCIPGIAIPTANVLSPLSTVFPLVILIFLFFVLSIFVPATIINGVYIVTCFPFIETVCFSLFM